jgi:hypothetical protein
LVRKRDGKGTLEGSRRRWENIIKTELNEVEWEGVDWTDVAVDRDKRWDFVNAAMKRRVS